MIKHYILDADSFSSDLVTAYATKDPNFLAIDHALVGKIEAFLSTRILKSLSGLCEKLNEFFSPPDYFEQELHHAVRVPSFVLESTKSNFASIWNVLQFYGIAIELL
ncbi:hypothetical protein RF11_02633 [Thelohanellus kitauei]|uniref:Uncharacterized protein n=1 Tax=Thelohanellus kitauei TaxID=669202 RepID=A0A0C2JBI1_THEKT|nr:hypothetical protein RF11_12255 [Thelohanellus kitauei]KII75229.1 hypothetical protein RF11_02633 [Thelohanellus kitauei]